ncbi:hypothetical protein GJAV_G00100270 [Gymnothorax javanicus]|nr:hypothetical protein GJAV_G00100270 [Gymnothorax javanicus]
MDSETRIYWSKMLRFSVFMLLPLGLAASLITCPDGKVCPRSSTCCETDNGYECCPVPNAICCPDRLHCCPRGFQCNNETQMCEKPVGSTPMLWKMQANPSDLLPPYTAVSDLQTTEQDECCLSTTGCCPGGFHCNEDKACVRSTEQDPSAVLHCSPKAGSPCVVTYCDRNFYCPVNNTCCKNPSGEWSCCPYPLGQCCPDMIHCCQYGTKSFWVGDHQLSTS